MMRTSALVVMVIFVASAAAQEIPKPGPEHKQLKKMEGTWDTVMKAGDKEHKGTATFKMQLGGLWLSGSLESDLDKEKFHGKSMDSYDAKKKKYVSVWFDSMSTTPMTMEGTYDEKKKTLTMIGDGMGMDGKPAKWKSVTETKDDDNVLLSMYVGDAKEPMFTVSYKRKKKYRTSRTWPRPPGPAPSRAGKGNGADTVCDPTGNRGLATRTSPLLLPYGLEASASHSVSPETSDETAALPRLRAVPRPHAGDPVSVRRSALRDRVPCRKSPSRKRRCLPKR